MIYQLSSIPNKIYKLTPGEKSEMELTIKVICKDLPGTEFINEAGGLHYRNVHLGIQRGESVIETVRGDSRSAEFAPVFKVAELPAKNGANSDRKSTRLNSSH